MSKLDARLASCTETRSDSEIKVAAHTRKAVFVNQERAEVSIIDVDCWLVAETGARADCIVSKPQVVDIVVELKGKKIDRALEQILATSVRWKEVRPLSTRLGALIVFSRSPNRSAAMDDVKKRFRQTHGIWLEMGKNELTKYRFETFAGKKA
jgi:hypothetical protein